MIRCTFPDCIRPPMSPEMSRCEAHRLRWTPGQPASPEVVRERRFPLRVEYPKAAA